MSLFKKLFGKKKKEPALSASESILKLQETESLLLKKQKNLEEKIAEEQETAKQNAPKNKRVALQALKRKKRYEQQLDKLLDTIATLETQRNTLENSTLNEDILKTLKEAGKAMKNANKQLNIDDVNVTIDQINETNDLVNEVSDAIAGIAISNVDNDELEKELEGLKKEKLDEELMKLSSTPEVPNTDLPTAKKDKDEDLRKLEQLAN